MSYFDLQKVGVFSRTHSFQKVAKSPLEWLKSQGVYTLHKPVKRRFPCRNTIVPGANFQMQADFIDFSSLKQYNDNFKDILVVSDVFSKKGFISFLKTKTSSEMIRPFEEVLPKIGRFQKLQTDLGSEFFNRPFQAWLKRQNIEHFHTYNFDTKAAMVERFIRTLKEKFWRFFSHTNSR